MLKNIDPLLNADLLWVLAAMGHGDDLALVDANHPADTVASHCIIKKPLRVSASSMAEVARAIALVCVRGTQRAGALVMHSPL